MKACRMQSRIGGALGSRSDCDTLSWNLPKLYAVGTVSPFRKCATDKARKRAIERWLEEARKAETERGGAILPG